VIPSALALSPKSVLNIPLGKYNSIAMTIATADKMRLIFLLFSS
jgi:hypothetical protein